MPLTIDLSFSQSCLVLFKVLAGEHERDPDCLVDCIARGTLGL